MEGVLLGAGGTAPEQKPILCLHKTQCNPQQKKNQKRLLVLPKEFGISTHVKWTYMFHLVMLFLWLSMASNLQPLFLPQSSVCLMREYVRGPPSTAKNIRT